MAKKNKISINRRGDILSMKITDPTYRCLYKGKFKLNSIKDMYYLFSTIEKFSSYSIMEVVNYARSQSWI